MGKMITSKRLRAENRRFRNTGGVSKNNRNDKFVPAFHDRETGRTEVSRLVGGMPAPIHLLDGLPDEWVVSRGGTGNVLAVKGSVVAGFLRDGRFYTREEAARACMH